VIGPKSRLTLEQYRDVSDNMGGQTRSWIAKKTVKGVLTSAKGNKTVVRDKQTVTITHRFYSYFFTDVVPTEKDRFLNEKTNDIYDIMVVDSPFNRKMYLFDLTIRQKVT